MRVVLKRFNLWAALSAAIGAAVLVPGLSWAHCDTMDGPVVKDALTALEREELAPALKWVHAEDEPEIHRAFEKALAVRTKGEDARELADQFFLETLVRVHRLGEGASYTGLKSAGTDVGPAVALADEALETGSGEALIDFVLDEAAEGIHRRFERALDARQRADEDVEAGRDFVEAYVEFVHYVEGVHEAVATEHAHHAGTGVMEAHEARGSGPTDARSEPRAAGHAHGH